MKCLWYVWCVMLPLVGTVNYDDYDAVYDFKKKCEWGIIEIKKSEAFLVISSHATLSGPNCTIGFFHEGKETREICVAPDESFSISDCDIKLIYQKNEEVNLKSYTCNDNGEEFCLETKKDILFISLYNADTNTGADLELKVYIKEDYTWIIILIITLVCIVIVAAGVALWCYCKHKKNKLSPGKVIAPPAGHSFGALTSENRFRQNYGPPLSQKYGLPQQNGTNSYGLPQQQTSSIWNTDRQYGMQFDQTPQPINSAPNENELYGPTLSYSNFAQKK